MARAKLSVPKVDSILQRRCFAGVLQVFLSDPGSLAEFFWHRMQAAIWWWYCENYIVEHESGSEGVQMGSAVIFKLLLYFSPQEMFFGSGFTEQVSIFEAIDSLISPNRCQWNSQGIWAPSTQSLGQEPMPPAMRSLLVSTSVALCKFFSCKCEMFSGWSVKPPESLVECLHKQPIIYLHLYNGHLSKFKSAETSHYIIWDGSLVRRRHFYRLTEKPFSIWLAWLSSSLQEEGLWEYKRIEDLDGNPLGFEFQLSSRVETVWLQYVDI